MYNNYYVKYCDIPFIQFLQQKETKLIKLNSKDIEKEKERERQERERKREGKRGQWLNQVEITTEAR